MKDFFGVTNNDWFAFLSQQPLLPKIVSQKDGGNEGCVPCVSFKVFDALNYYLKLQVIRKHE